MQLPRKIIIAAITLSCIAMAAQQEQQASMGSIATRDALVTGGLEVQGEHAQLLTAASVTAHGHTAPIILTRGGDVLVCSTSRFHILRSGKESALIFALDRGAIEIHGDSQTDDVVLTPDLRMTFASAGPLDLRLRVTPNGDTCVENTGESAPQIAISDAFSDSEYHLRPGQHVLFEHGSVREVVDQEQSPCGCPAEIVPSFHLAENRNATTDVAEQNPFPAAVSQGLAPEAKPVSKPAIPKDESSPQPTSALAYSATPEPVASAPSAPVATSSTQPASLAPPPAPPGAHDIVHALGRFFRRLFGGKDKPRRAKS